MEGKRKDWRIKWFERVEKSLKSQRVPPYVLPALLTVAVSILVYLTGGIKLVYSHTMYIPIILAAFSNGLKGGIIFGLLGGLVLGPFMPLDVASGQPQETIIWLYRMGFFVLIGGLAGIAFEAMRCQMDQNLWMARHEPLTGFKNRYALTETLITAIKSDVPTKPTALAIVSFENSSKIQASFGTRALHEAIIQLWSRIEQTIETGTQLFRIQNNEIGVLFFDKTKPEIESALDSLTLKAKLPYFSGDSIFHGEIRIAATEIAPFIEEPEFYLQECEAALHKGETEPTEHSPYFNNIDMDSERETLSLLGELQKAMESSNALHLHYQPKVDLKTLALTGAEALIRWEHSGLGSIPPDRFIPHAENTTLINQLTDWVIEHALLQIVQWRKTGMKLPVSVNVSVRNLHQKDFVAKVENALTRHQIDASLLELEITESVLMQDAENMINRLNALRALGIRISIDDYGTGFSSLKYMLQIPAVSPIKIDTFFVQNMASEKNARNLVQSIISVTHGLAKEVLAEGVEDKKTFDLLADMGCDMAQGFFIGRPMPPDEFLAWRKEWEEKHNIKTAATDRGHDNGMGKNTERE